MKSLIMVFNVCVFKESRPLFVSSSQSSTNDRFSVINSFKVSVSSDKINVKDSKLKKMNKFEEKEFKNNRAA